MSPQRNANQEPQSTGGKPAGLLLLALSFLPWAVFWALVRTSLPAGVAIALGISCVLLAHQVWTGSYRLLDITTFVSFLLAAIATFLLESSLLLTAGTLLSFGILLAVALVSVGIRRPFTADAARLEYPRQYWRNPAFITLHTIITLVWAGVFLLCGIVVAFTNSTAAGPVPIVLIVLGFAFTIVFQIKGPALLVMQRYRPFEWHVQLAPSGSRQQNEYDVAVIGAGIGGLTCAGLLAQRGYKVLVLEQQSQVGGYCRSLERGDFAFSAGVSGVTGVWDNGPVRRVLQQLGISPDGKFAAHDRRYVYKGGNIDTGSDMPSLVAGLAQAFPEERPQMESFFQEASDAFFQLHEYSSRFGSPLPDHLVVRLMGDRAAAHLPRLYPALYDWMGKTLQQKLDEHFQNDGIKTIVAAASGQNGTAPEATPGLRALIGCIGPQITGTYFPAGGPGALAEAMARAVESHGGTVMLNYRADRILTDQRQVRGVRSGAEIFQAHVVVANVNPRTCVLQLVEANEIGGLYIDFIKSLPMSRSAFVVYAGIEEDLSGYPSLIENIDGDFTILINSNMDPRLAPVGRSSITLIAPMGYRDFPPRDERDYDDRKRQFAALLLRKASEVLPGISDRVADLDAATPRTLESYTSMPEGALYGFDQSVGSRRPHFRAPIKGLYFAGASTFPGAGVESAMQSGMICANDISGWAKGDGRNR
jgi:all-trans-retinol 13,14-reductase